MDDPDDPVFKALADPTRRLILDRLRERDGLSLTELEAAVAPPTGMTRFGVMKHVRVLVEAGLVTTRRVGRTTLHHLNPVPIRLIHDRWISKYSEPHVSALSALKQRLERPMPDSLVYQIYIKATPEQVWEAITTTEFRRQYFYGSTIESSFEVGSPLVSHSADGQLWGDDIVLECDPPRVLSHTWRSLWYPGAAEEPASRVTWTIEPQEGGYTRLTVLHDQLGESPKTAESVSGGWSLVISGLKTLLETGAPLAGA